MFKFKARRRSAPGCGVLLRHPHPSGPVGRHLRRRQEQADPGEWRFGGRAARTPRRLGVRGGRAALSWGSLIGRARARKWGTGRKGGRRPEQRSTEKLKSEPAKARRRRGAGGRRGSTRPPGGAGCSWGGPAARPTPRRPARPSPPPGVGRTHSMIRETCSRTGTLLSLKAVVMKQPNVSAAITLSEKANSEFARDSTVFISADARRTHRGTGTAGTPFRQRTGSRRSAPPVPRVPGRAPPRPRLLSGPGRDRARASPLPGHTHQRAGRAQSPRAWAARGASPCPSANQRRGGAGFRRGRSARLVLRPLARPGSACPASFLRLFGSLCGTVASWVLTFRYFAFKISGGARSFGACPDGSRLKAALYSAQLSPLSSLIKVRTSAFGEGVGHKMYRITERMTSLGSGSKKVIAVELLCHTKDSLHFYKVYKFIV